MSSSLQQIHYQYIDPDPETNLTDEIIVCFHQTSHSLIKFNIKKNILLFYQCQNFNNLLYKLKNTLNFLNYFTIIYEILPIETMNLYLILGENSSKDLQIILLNLSGVVKYETVIFANCQSSYSCMNINQKTREIYIILNDGSFLSYFIKLTKNNSELLIIKKKYFNLYKILIKSINNNNNNNNDDDNNDNNEKTLDENFILSDNDRENYQLTCVKSHDLTNLITCLTSSGIIFTMECTRFQMVYYILPSNFSLKPQYLFVDSFSSNFLVYCSNKNEVNHNKINRECLEFFIPPQDYAQCSENYFNRYLIPLTTSSTTSSSSSSSTFVSAKIETICTKSTDKSNLLSPYRTFISVYTSNNNIINLWSLRGNEPNLKLESTLLINIPLINQLNLNTFDNYNNKSFNKNFILNNFSNQFFTSSSFLFDNSLSLNKSLLENNSNVTNKNIENEIIESISPSSISISASFMVLIVSYGASLFTVNIHLPEQIDDRLNAAIMEIEVDYLKNLKLLAYKYQSIQNTLSNFQDMNGSYLKIENSIEGDLDYNINEEESNDISSINSQKNEDKIFRVEEENSLSSIHTLAENSSVTQSNSECQAVYPPKILISSTLQNNSSIAQSSSSIYKKDEFKEENNQSQSQIYQNNNIPTLSNGDLEKQLVTLDHHPLIQSSSLKSMGLDSLSILKFDDDNVNEQVDGDIIAIPSPNGKNNFLRSTFSQNCRYFFPNSFLGIDNSFSKFAKTIYHNVYRFLKPPGFLINPSDQLFHFSNKYLELIDCDYPNISSFSLRVNFISISFRSQLVLVCSEYNECYVYSLVNKDVCIHIPLSIENGVKVTCVQSADISILSPNQISPTKPTTHLFHLTGRFSSFTFGDSKGNLHMYIIDSERGIIRTSSFSCYDKSNISHILFIGDTSRPLWVIGSDMYSPKGNHLVQNPLALTLKETPGSCIVTVSGDGLVKTWQPTFFIPDSEINSLVFSKDLKVDEKTLPQQLERIVPHSNILFHNSGYFSINTSINNDNSTLEKSRNFKTFSTHSSFYDVFYQNENIVSSVAVAPGCLTLIFGLYDGSLQQWVIPGLLDFNSSKSLLKSQLSTYKSPIWTSSTSKNHTSKINSINVQVHTHSLSKINPIEISSSSSAEREEILLKLASYVKSSHHSAITGTQMVVGLTFPQFQLLKHNSLMITSSFDRSLIVWGFSGNYSSPCYYLSPIPMRRFFFSHVPYCGLSYSLQTSPSPPLASFIFQANSTTSLNYFNNLTPSTSNLGSISSTATFASTQQAIKQLNNFIWRVQASVNGRVVTVLEDKFSNLLNLEDETEYLETKYVQSPLNSLPSQKSSQLFLSDFRGATVGDPKIMNDSESSIISQPYSVGERVKSVESLPCITPVLRFNFLVQGHLNLINFFQERLWTINNINLLFSSYPVKDVDVSTGENYIALGSKPGLNLSKQLYLYKAKLSSACIYDLWSNIDYLDQDTTSFYTPSNTSHSNHLTAGTSLPTTTQSTSNFKSSAKRDHSKISSTPKTALINGNSLLIQSREIIDSDSLPNTPAPLRSEEEEIPKRFVINKKKKDVKKLIFDDSESQILQPKFYNGHFQKQPLKPKEEIVNQVKYVSKSTIDKKDYQAFVYGRPKGTSPSTVLFGEKELNTFNNIQLNSAAISVVSSDAQEGENLSIDTDLKNERYVQIKNSKLIRSPLKNGEIILDDESETSSTYIKEGSIIFNGSPLQHELKKNRTIYIEDEDLLKEEENIRQEQENTKKDRKLSEDKFVIKKEKKPLNDAKPTIKPDKVDTKQIVLDLPDKKKEKRNKHTLQLISNLLEKNSNNSKYVIQNMPKKVASLVQPVLTNIIPVLDDQYSIKEEKDKDKEKDKDDNESEGDDVPDDISEVTIWFDRNAAPIYLEKQKPDRHVLKSKRFDKPPEPEEYKRRKDFEIDLDEGKKIFKKHKKSMKSNDRRVTITDPMSEIEKNEFLFDDEDQNLTVQEQFEEENEIDFVPDDLEDSTYIDEEGNTKRINRKLNLQLVDSSDTSLTYSLSSNFNSKFYCILVNNQDALIENDVEKNEEIENKEDSITFQNLQERIVNFLSLYEYFANPSYFSNIPGFVRCKVVSSVDNSEVDISFDNIRPDHRYVLYVFPTKRPQRLLSYDYSKFLVNITSELEKKENNSESGPGSQENLVNESLHLLSNVEDGAGIVAGNSLDNAENKYLPSSTVNIPTQVKTDENGYNSYSSIIQEKNSHIPNPLIWCKVADTHEERADIDWNILTTDQKIIELRSSIRSRYVQWKALSNTTSSGQHTPIIIPSDQELSSTSINEFIERNNTKIVPRHVIQYIEWWIGNKGSISGTSSVRSEFLRREALYSAAHKKTIADFMAQVACSQYELTAMLSYVEYELRELGSGGIFKTKNSTSETNSNIKTSSLISTEESELFQNLEEDTDNISAITADTFGTGSLLSTEVSELVGKRIFRRYRSWWKGGLVLLEVLEKDRERLSSAIASMDSNSNSTLDNDDNSLPIKVVYQQNALKKIELRSKNLLSSILLINKSIEKVKNLFNFSLYCTKNSLQFNDVIYKREILSIKELNSIMGCRRLYELLVQSKINITSSSLEQSKIDNPESLGDLGELLLVWKEDKEFIKGVEIRNCNPIPLIFRSLFKISQPNLHNFNIFSTLFCANWTSFACIVCQCIAGSYLFSSDINELTKLLEGLEPSSLPPGMDQTYATLPGSLTRRPLLPWGFLSPYDKLLEIALACSLDDIWELAIEDDIEIPEPEDLILVWKFYVKIGKFYEINDENEEQNRKSIDDSHWFALRIQRWALFSEWYAGQEAKNPIPGKGIPTLPRVIFSEKCEIGLLKMKSKELEELIRSNNLPVYGKKDNEKEKSTNEDDESDLISENKKEEALINKSLTGEENLLNLYEKALLFPQGKKFRINFICSSLDLIMFSRRSTALRLFSPPGLNKISHQYLSFPYFLPQLPAFMLPPKRYEFFPSRLPKIEYSTNELLDWYNENIHEDDDDKMRKSEEINAKLREYNDWASKENERLEYSRSEMILEDILAHKYRSLNQIYEEKFKILEKKLTKIEDYYSGLVDQPYSSRISEFSNEKIEEDNYIEERLEKEVESNSLVENQSSITLTQDNQKNIIDLPYNEEDLINFSIEKENTHSLSLIVDSFSNSPSSKPLLHENEEFKSEASEFNHSSRPYRFLASIPKDYHHIFEDTLEYVEGNGLWNDDEVEELLQQERQRVLEAQREAQAFEKRLLMEKLKRDEEERQRLRREEQERRLREGMAQRRQIRENFEKIKQDRLRAQQKLENERLLREEEKRKEELRQEEEARKIEAKKQEKEREEGEILLMMNEEFQRREYLVRSRELKLMEREDMLSFLEEVWQAELKAKRDAELARLNELFQPFVPYDFKKPRLPALHDFLDNAQDSLYDHDYDTINSDYPHQIEFQPLLEVGEEYNEKDNQTLGSKVIIKKDFKNKNKLIGKPKFSAPIVYRDLYAIPSKNSINKKKSIDEDISSQRSHTNSLALSSNVSLSPSYSPSISSSQAQSVSSQSSRIPFHANLQFPTSTSQTNLPHVQPPPITSDSLNEKDKKISSKKKKLEEILKLSQDMLEKKESHLLLEPEINTLYELLNNSKLASASYNSIISAEAKKQKPLLTQKTKDFLDSSAGISSSASYVSSVASSVASTSPSVSQDIENRKKKQEEEKRELMTDGLYYKKNDEIDPKTKILANLAREKVDKLKKNKHDLFHFLDSDPISTSNNQYLLLASEKNPINSTNLLNTPEVQEFALSIQEKYKNDPVFDFSSTTPTIRLSLSQPIPTTANSILSTPLSKSPKSSSKAFKLNENEPLPHIITPGSNRPRIDISTDYSERANKNMDKDNNKKEKENNKKIVASASTPLLNASKNKFSAPIFGSSIKLAENNKKKFKLSPIVPLSSTVPIPQESYSTSTSSNPSTPHLSGKDKGNKVINLFIQKPQIDDDILSL